MEYRKPPLSITDQVTKLESRGLIVDDRAKAEHYLSYISYYRLSAYLFPFRETDSDHYKEDTHFDKILDIYIFDRELRLLIFDAIERIEIAYRTQAIYCPAMKLGPFWYEYSRNFRTHSIHQDCLEKLDREFARSRETFIDHFRTKYEETTRPPAWMIFEVCPFGLVTRMCVDMSDYSIHNDIAAAFGFPGTQRPIFESWIQSVVYVRNVCAHHSRLWNRKLVIKPQMFKKTAYPWIDTKGVGNSQIYYFLSATFFLLQRIIPGTSFGQRLKQLLVSHPNIPLVDMGFPADWESQDLWK